MATLNERVEEALTRHDVEIIRFEAGLIKDAAKDLGQLEAEIIRELKGAEPRTKRQLEVLLGRSRLSKPRDRRILRKGALSRNDGQDKKKDLKET